MTTFPSELLEAIAAGDAVLWTGSQIGEWADAPGWTDLLGALVEAEPSPQREELDALIEQGRLRPVFAHFAGAGAGRRREQLHALLEASAASARERTLPPGAAAVGQLPWRACIASLYPELLGQALSAGGRAMELLRHREVHELTLRDEREPFVLSSPLALGGMRADETFFNLIEEILATRTLLLVGFDIDDPDLQPLLGLLQRVGVGRTHYAWMPFVSGPEAAELEATSRLQVIHADDGLDLGAAFAELAQAVRAHGEAAPSQVSRDGAALDLARALRKIPARADFATDVALNLDPIELAELVEQAKTAGDALPPRVALSLGSALLAHGQWDRARRLFNRVVARDPGAEAVALAQFDLALLAASEGDTETAVASLNAAAERHRAMALVPPRFQLDAVLGHRGSRWDLVCTDRSSRQSIHLELATVDHITGPDAHARFMAGVKALAGLDHPHQRRVYGGFADGQVFGLICEPIEGRSLAELIPSGGRMSFEDAFRVMGPVMDLLERAHAHGVVHGMLHPLDVWITADGPRVRGWGLAPAVHYRRPSVQEAQRGYTAPELLRGGAPTPASDVYALGAMLYRAVTGVEPGGSVLAPGRLLPELDPRLDDIVLGCMHPEPDARPSPAKLREQLATLRATPAPARRGPDAATPRDQEAAAPPATPKDGGSPPPADLDQAPPPPPSFDHGGDEEAPDTLRSAAPPTSSEAEREAATAAAPEAGVPVAVGPDDSGIVRIKAPEDPDDLEGWTWVLEQKPEHMEAREQVARIEAESREAGRWDRVADVLRVRAELSQVQDERVAMLRELAEILEQKLGAPAFAHETLASVMGEVSLKAKVELADDLLRLADVTGKWAEVAAEIAPVADAAPSMDDRGRLHAALARIYAEELGAVERAHGSYVRALEAAPEDGALHEEAAEFYRRSRMPVELAPVLLGLAELESGAARHERLLEAAALLDEDLEEPEAAFDTVESVLADDPSHGAGLELGEDLARRLERHEALARILVARSEQVDDDTRVAMWLEVAKLREEQLGDRVGALDALDELTGIQPDHAEGVQASLRVLRAAVEAQELPGERLTEALMDLGDRAETPGARADALMEAAERYAAEDARERAADARERVLGELPGNDPRVETAVAALEAHYIAIQDGGALGALYDQRARNEELPVAARIHAWTGLLKLAKDVDPDPTRAMEALEALHELEPETSRWRDELLDLYMAEGDSEGAAALVAERAEAAGDQGAKADALVDLAKLRANEGDLEQARAKLDEALALDPGRASAWRFLAELHDRAGDAAEAGRARVRAATLEDDVELLVAAARDALGVLEAPEQAQGLLARAVQLNPDHLEATEGLMRAFLAADDLASTRGLAEARISQLERQRPDDRGALVETLSIAGRCALASGDADRAKELLARARGLDGANREVARLLADLQLAAGEYGAALASYQSVALSDEGEAAVEVYMSMAACHEGLGQAAKQCAMYERVLELSPDHEGAIRGLIDAAEAPRAKLDAMLALVSMLERRDQEDAGDARAKLLLEAGQLAAGPVGDVDEGVALYQRALELQPGDIELLHALLDTYTSHERWYEATEILERLAELQDDPGAAAKYLYAGAVLIRDNVQDAGEALARMRKVLEVEPLHEKAFRYTVEAFEQAGDPKEISRVIRARLKALPEGAVADRVKLFDQLGALYEVDLDDPKTALAAYEQAIALAGRGDDEERQARVRRTYELALEMGDDERDKAIQMAQLVIERRPMDFDAYHQLLRMFVGAGLRDSAVCVARALRFLKQANAQEMELANVSDRGFNPPRGVMTGELWTQALLHPEHSPWLSELFAIIWAVVCARTGQRHSHLGLERDAREQITGQSQGFARILAHACQTLDLPLPDLFLRAGQPGGARVGALSDGKRVYPTVIAGDDVLAKQDERLLAFRAGRAAARVAPTNLLASVLPSSMSLRDAAFGARLCVNPGAEVPSDSREAAEGIAAALNKQLPAPHREHLGKIIEGVFARGTDTHQWMRGVEFTATRAGFLMADSLEMSAKVLSLGTGDLGGVPPKDLIKDLVSYSVSAPYLRLRRQLKQSL